MGSRDEPFAAFVNAYRARLLGTAALIHLEPERAGPLVHAVLAQVYAAWPRLDDPYAYAVRAVLSPAWAGVQLPGEAATRFELVDVDAARPRFGDGILSELAALSEDERRVLVLASYTHLPLVEIAAVLGRDVTDVISQLRAATDRLQSMPRLNGRRRLAAELAAAAPVSPPAGNSAASRQPVPDAPRAGRSLLRHRRLRALAVAAALAVLVGFAVRQAAPLLSPVASSGPQLGPQVGPQVSVRPTERPPCDTTEPRCRADIVSGWRLEMARVISAHLDPDGDYFTGFSYSYTEGYQGSDFWDGGGGALGLDLYRMTGGATEVYLQIATTRSYAIRCGELTKRPCHTTRFMDGNRFTLTDPSTVAQGLEAQHRPEGTFVITVVARNTSRASRELPVTRADMVDLVADPRLRLPPH
ncbi:MAG TPA: hypothetical protein VIT42_12050 [Microlunatus sp.]